jgi:hypothetical protein
MRWRVVEISLLRNRTLLSSRIEDDVRHAEKNSSSETRCIPMDITETGSVITLIASTRNTSEVNK